MRVLVACEWSGIVRDAFLARGHDAFSCDLRESEWPGPHIRGDVRRVLGLGWDLMIAHPPCTHLATSGAAWFAHKPVHLQERAVDFVRTLLAAPIRRIAIENPVSVLSSCLRPPDQIVRPWMFGHPETKAVCLWFKHLWPLVATNPLPRTERHSTLLHHPPSTHRGKDRSRFYHGIAEAMADQWSVFD